MDTEALLRTIVAKWLGAPDDEITTASTPATLGADSLDILEVVRAAEEEFVIDLPDAELENVKTFGDLLALVEQKLAAQASDAAARAAAEAAARAAAATPLAKVIALVKNEWAVTSADASTVVGTFASSADALADLVLALRFRFSLDLADTAIRSEQTLQDVAAVIETALQTRPAAPPLGVGRTKARVIRQKTRPGLAFKYGLMRGDDGQVYKFENFGPPLDQTVDITTRSDGKDPYAHVTGMSVGG